MRRSTSLHHFLKTIVDATATSTPPNASATSAGSALPLPVRTIMIATTPPKPNSSPAILLGPSGSRKEPRRDERERVR